MRARLVAAGLCAAALGLVARPASAQNADPFFFGDEAAVSGGAVVASGRDSGSLWYNPAGFGGMRRGTLNASGTTFGIRYREIPDALRVRAGGRETGTALRSTDIVSVPNAIVIALRMSDRVSIAGGLLVTARDVRSALLREGPTERTSSDGERVKLSERLDLQSDLSKYHLGFAAGAQVSDRVRVGLALFGTYTKETGNLQFSLAGDSPTVTEDRVFLVQSSRITDSSFGVTATAGVQWEASPDVHVGFAVRTPEIAFAGFSEGGGVVGVASTGGGEPAFVRLAEIPTEAPGARGTLVSPARAHLGAAFSLGPRRAWLEIGMDAAHGLPETALIDAQRPTLNGRVGVRYPLSEEWLVGGGVFTDRSTLRSVPVLIGGDRVDYYGVALGASKRTPLALVRDPSPDALVLVTTFSLRAAAGVGEARATTLELEATSGPRDDRSNVTFFDLMPYVGSSVAF